MRVVLREGAYADLDRIFNWIAKDRPRSAHAVVERILDSMAHLGHFPHVGHRGRSPRALEWVVPGLPYIVLYRIDQSAELIDVILIVHGAQDRDSK